VFEVFNHDELQAIPSFTGIRKWLGRMGIYELKRENEYRDDWIFIVDFTVELGQQKALVILGVSQKYFQEEVLDRCRCLSHKDVEVLGIEIMDSTKGEMIEQQLDKISERVGVPVQIVADNGSDLAKGIKLYQQKHPGVIYTHDVTHAMALLLKKQLNSDERYQSFIKECDICRQKLQQTELSFLASSDVIESLFGKYKHFSSRCPLKEMGQMILTIYLSTMDLTTNLIKDALETISFVDVEDWLTDVFGRSTLSKRKILLSSDCCDTKTV
jgi:hypothetical protein